MDVPWARSFFEEGMEKGMEKGIEKGIEKGREEGKEDERRKFIRILHQNGMSADEIARMANLSMEYVRHVLAGENGTAPDLDGGA
jgi:predicted transposase/invertase (TIGR01784 family)